MEIYAFGSIVRGEIDIYSDIDILVLKGSDEVLKDLDKEQYSIYTFQRLERLWKEGNPFAWHLYVESKCLYSTNEKSFISLLGEPNPYTSLKSDLKKFHDLFLESKDSILRNEFSIDFDLSMIFLSIRNFASCFALGYLKMYEFSRDSALKINEYSLQIDSEVYERLKQSRLLSTRGVGEAVTDFSLIKISSELDNIETWFNRILWMNF